MRLIRTLRAAARIAAASTRRSDVLTSGETRHVAIANPDLAPYGAAAKQALQGLGLWDELSGKIVMAENIGQTFAMVATGNARVGFVALSAALAPGNTHTFDSNEERLVIVADPRPRWRLW